MAHFLYFISSHGFGHAARACAVMAALDRRRPGSRFTLFTTVPRWFLDESLDGLTGRFDVEPLDCDLGLVQTNALEEDLPATLRELGKRIPFTGERLDPVVRRIEELGGDLVIADIAPLGLAAAKHCGLPAVLVENFTWDWIYRGYLDQCPELGAIADHFEEAFALADLHVQTEPVCAPRDGARRVPPICRQVRTGRDEIRRRLGVGEGEPVVVLTMGGVRWSYASLAAELTEPGDPWLVIPGDHGHERRGRVIRLPHRSSFYHPDLIHAADAVVGKLGYSTLAEVWQAGVPLGYLTRPRFRESPLLEAWVRREIPCRRFEPSDLEDGSWLAGLRELVRKPRGAPRRVDAADAVAKLVTALLI